MSVLAKGHVKVVEPEAAWTIAGEDEFISVWRHERAVFHRVGIDFGSEILRRSPRVVDARPMRNVDVETAEAARAI